MKLLHLFLIAFNLFIMAHTKKHKHRHKSLNKTVQVVPSLSVNIPLIENVQASCSCAAASPGSSPCHPLIYIDYYYNPPYTGYPANSSYLPPSDSIPVIVDRLTNIRDVVKNFVQSTKQEDSDIKQALYIKNNYETIHYILKAISKASNTTKI